MPAITSWQSRLVRIEECPHAAADRFSAAGRGAVADSRSTLSRCCFNGLDLCDLDRFGLAGLAAFVDFLLIDAPVDVW